MSAPQCTEERIELDFVQAERLFYNKMHSDAREFLKAQFNLNQATLSMTSAVMSRMTALRQCCDRGLLRVEVLSAYMLPNSKYPQTLN